MVEEPRAALARLASERRISLAELSRLIGRNPAYVQQHVARGSPRRLDERDREVIAAYLGVDEAMLGGRAAGDVSIPRFNLAASAGPGGVVEIDQPAVPMALPPALLRSLKVRADHASMIRVAGDSMHPTLDAGDEILVDSAQTAVPGGGGVFVLRIDEVLMVKRVRADGPALIVTSDNPAAPSPGRVDVARVRLIGRVVWVSRRL
ncbi:S24 family peptidase [Sphingomonas sp.]|uniref:S24 family peptidase n=1 Tax=Sphingomonas sp. TaxID=28214 RepID=UPI002C18121C|nr:S24 family peptidase [Sphingomonas sp.]HTG37487.1 S24 family peptidase [Sphingomonas sp.]